MEIDKLNVTITKTADGRRDYIQIMSADQISVNIVFVADRINIQDHRVIKGKWKKGGRL